MINHEEVRTNTSNTKQARVTQTNPKKHEKPRAMTNINEQTNTRKHEQALANMNKREETRT